MKVLYREANLPDDSEGVVKVLCEGVKVLSLRRMSQLLQVIIVGREVARRVLEHLRHL